MLEIGGRYQSVHGGGRMEPEAVRTAIVMSLRRTSCNCCRSDV